MKYPLLVVLSFFCFQNTFPMTNSENQEKHEQLDYKMASLIDRAIEEEKISDDEIEKIANECFKLYPEYNSAFLKFCYQLPQILSPREKKIIDSLTEKFLSSLQTLVY